MSITLTGYRIKIKAGNTGVKPRPCEYKILAKVGNEQEMIANIRADGYKGKICPQYSGGN